MSVALHDLSRRRLGVEPEPLARDALDLGVDRGVVADGARELADAHALERARDSAPGAIELEGPDGELQAERRRLGVDTVRAADRQRLAVLVGALDDRGECLIDPVQDQLARRSDLQRERCVDDVGGGEPVVEPAARLAELASDGIDERGEVVVRLLLDLGHALSAGRLCLGANLLCSVGRDDAHLGPRIERRELDLEPPLELALVRPDPGHGRAGVAGNHYFDSSPALRVPAALGEDPRREDRRIPRAVDRDARDRDARRHLRDREQRVEPVADALRRTKWHADHRQVAVGGDDAGQRGRHPGPGDDHAHASQLGSRGVLGDTAGIAMRRQDLQLVGDPALPKLGKRRVHRLEVGLRPDEDADERAGLLELLQQPDRPGLSLRLSRQRSLPWLRCPGGSGHPGRRSARTPRTREPAPPRGCRRAQSR